MKKTVFSFFLLVIAITTVFLVSAVRLPTVKKHSSYRDLIHSRSSSLSVESESISSCMALLLTAANQAGITWSIGNTGDDTFEDGTRSCLVQFVEQPDTGLGRAFIFGLNETNKTPESSCYYDPMAGWSLTTLNGYNARTYYSLGDTRVIDDQSHTVESREITVCMHAGGRNYHLFVQSWTFSVQASGNAPDPEPIARILVSVAEDYLPLTDETYEIAEIPTVDPMIDPQNEGAIDITESAEGVDPEVVIVPYGGDGEEITTSTGSFDETWESDQAKALRSPLLPITGGLIGGGLAWLLAKGAKYALDAASSVNQAYTSYAQTSPESSATPPTLVTTPPELLTSPPELQTSPPEFLSAEAQQTKEMLEKGYIWTDSGGWQTKREIEQSAEWNRKNASVSADDDAAWREQWEAQKKTLEENDAKLKENAEKLNIESNLIDVSLELLKMDNELRKKSVYVFNPNQAIPVWNAITQAKNWAWDSVFGTRGLTCQGYVDETLPQVKKLVQEKFGKKLDKNLKVESYKFDEKSTSADTSEWLSPEAWMNWMDKGIDDNHNLIKVTLPDGSEWAVDFHQHNTGKRPPILRPWKDAVADWKPYLGESEFRESLIEG